MNSDQEDEQQLKEALLAIENHAELMRQTRNELTRVKKQFQALEQEKLDLEQKTTENAKKVCFSSAASSRPCQRHCFWLFLRQLPSRLFSFDLRSDFWCIFPQLLRVLRLGAIYFFLSIALSCLFCLAIRLRSSGNPSRRTF